MHIFNHCSHKTMVFLFGKTLGENVFLFGKSLGEYSDCVVSEQ